jgi:hypothetical protein
VNTLHAAILRNKAMHESGVDAVARHWRGDRIVYPAGYARWERCAWLAGVREARRADRRFVWMRLMVRPAPGRTRRCP